MQKKAKNFSSRFTLTEYLKAAGSKFGIKTSKGEKLKIRKIFLLLAIIFLSSCAYQQEVRVVQHWNGSASTLIHAVPVENGLLVVRKQNVRYVHALYSPEGLLIKESYSDRQIERILPVDQDIYLIENVSPYKNIVRRIFSSGKSKEISPEAYWTELVRDEEGHLLGFQFLGYQSSFTSLDVAPSALKIYDFSLNKNIFEDQFSYHYPIQAKRIFLVSPIDRKIRIRKDGVITEIGSIISTSLLPIARSDGEYIAWFGPQDAGTSLFSADKNGNIKILRQNIAPRTIEWLGKDLIFSEQNELTKEWFIKKISIENGNEIASYRVPLDITPNAIVCSPKGDFLGLPKDKGSLLLRLSDGFNQVMPDIPLSAWIFSLDGNILYFTANDELTVVKLN